MVERFKLSGQKQPFVSQTGKTFPPDKGREMNC